MEEIQNGCPDVWVLWQGMDVKECPAHSGEPPESYSQPQGLPLCDSSNSVCSLPQDCLCFSAIQHHH